MAHKKHRAKFSRWHRGKLQTSWHEFDSAEEAVAFAGTHDAGTVKVFDEEENLIHDNIVTQDTYA